MYIDNDSLCEEDGLQYSLHSTFQREFAENINEIFVTLTT